ncbi:MAG: DUF1735 domain-containing protein [Prevotella sp.]|jgi:hypothetical protein|nr:DUF1735 domain-containing protein [Prevotella sp.]
MKYYRLIWNKLLAVILILSGGFFTACADDDIKVGGIDEENYRTTGDVFGYVINVEGRRSTALVEFRDTGETELYLGLTKNVSQPVNVVFKYNKAVLDSYNATNESSYELFPENLVTFQNGGSVDVLSGESKSNSLPVSFRSDASLDPSKSYAIPVSAELKSGDIKIGEATNYLIFVKDLTQLPDAGKASGIKIISCMEVNDTNPLNNLLFTLKDSGKPLVDIVILFSGNINYDSETGKVYNYNNPNIQHLLDNHGKYLKPMQDRGIKIVLGILGNHDRSGVANLADETARAFAKELKAVCDAYHLDGIFWDDEYSTYQTPPPVGFVSPSNAAAARLCYETKKIMPDKLTCAYVYGRTYSFPSVDGVQPGEFVDWGIHDYGGSSDLSGNYPGLQKSGMALYSQEFARNYYTSDSNLQRLRSNGYGGHMIFAMDPFRTNFSSRQLPAMESIAKILFDEELVYAGDDKRYSKDW